MKKVFSLRMLVRIFVCSVLLSIGSCSKGDDSETAQSLTDAEKTDLIQLREEEKLARDVYLYAFDKYGLNVSKNISNSEQAHMDQVLAILSVYGLSDPVKEEQGAFANSELQSLYDELVGKVDESLLDALVVGAMIEDLDIKDIEDFEARTEKNDLLDLYDNLKCGSRNHLRSYCSQLELNGGQYAPLYISQSQFESILASDSERCGQ